MPIMPASKGRNKWLICFTLKIDGAVKFVKEEFQGTVREAMIHEMQLRGLAKDGCLDFDAS